MIRKRILPTLAILGVGYMAIDAVVPNADMLLAQRVLQAAAAAAVMYVYWPDAWSAFVTRKPQKGDFLVLGIWLGMASTFCQAVYSVVYRLVPPDVQAWLQNANPVGVWIFTSILACVLHLLAPGVIGGVVPRRNRMALGGALGCAVVLTLYLVIARPDIGPIVNGLKPYIADWWRTGSLAPSTDTG